MTTTSSFVNVTLQQAQGNLVSEMNGEKVMMSITNSKYYNLGQVGGRIWELLETPTTMEQIVNQLLEEYDVDRETCEEQVIQYLTMLQTEGLLVTAS